MFQAPAFPHAPRPTDYLLARRPRPRAKLRGHGLYQVDDPDQNISEMVIRKIPRIYVVGQTEPQMEVYDVGQQASKKNFNELEKHFAEYHLGRYFDSKDEGTPVDLHQAMALWRHQPFGPEFLKKRLAAVADCDKTTGLWYRKPEGQFPPLEELAARFRPEDVCAYEACLRGRLRARDAGIARLTNPQKVADALRWLQQRLKAKRARTGKAQRRADAARSGGASRERRARAAALARVAEVLQAQVRELQRVIEVARYIRTELLWSPWYQTQSFVQVHLQGKESGKLRLTGIGDPSGVGEGFSFVREEKVAGKAEKANALKLTGTDELVKQVTGTTADLRKLSMKDSERILLNLGMTPAEVKALKRWDRIYLIRYKCTAAVSAGGATSLDLAKFSRGGRMSHAAEMKLYRERCNDIWARQAAALSSSAAATAEEAAPAGGGGRRAPTPVEDEAGDDGLNSEPEEAEDAEDSSSSMDDMEDEIFGDVEEEKAPQPAQEQARLAQLRQAMADETEAEQEAKEAAAAAARRDALWFLKGEIPKHAVKQVKRVVDPKGVETLTVSFNTDPKLLPKVRLATNLLVKKGAKPSALGDFQGPLAARREAAAAAAAETLRGRGGGRGRGRGRGGRGGGRSGPTTLNLTQISRRIKQHKDAQVARKEREERERLEELHPHRKRRGQARARRQSARARLPHAKLNAVLERVLAKLMARRDSLVFHNPVNKREVPAYYTVITNPMDLRKVKTKILEFEYHSAAPFLDDLRLMRDNARTFNGEVSTITKEAVALVRQAEEEVAALRAELEPLEQASAEHYGGGATGSQKRKRKARPPKAAGAAAGAAAAGPSSGASSGSEGGGGAARPVNLAALRGGGGGGGRRAEDNNSTGPESGAEEEGNNGDSSKKGGNPFIIY